MTEIRNTNKYNTSIYIKLMVFIVQVVTKVIVKVCYNFKTQS